MASDLRGFSLRSLIASGGVGVYVGAASLFLNILALALPLALLQVYDRIIPNASHGTLAMLMLGVLAAVVLEGVLRVARAVMLSWAGVQFEHRAGCDAFARIMAAPSDELEQKGAGELLERLAGLPTVREVFSEHWTLLVCDLPFVVLFLAVIGVIAGWLVVAPLAVLLAVVLSAARGSKRIRKALQAFNQVRDRRQNFSIEVIQGIHGVKSMAMEAQMVQRYARLQEAVAEASHSVTAANSAALNLGAGYSQVATLAVVTFGAMLVVEHHLSVGGLAACTMLTSRALQPVQKAVALWTRFQTATLMRERFASIYDLAQEPHPAEPVSRPVEGAVRLSGIGLTLGDGAVLFNGLDLEVAPGERIAIVGDNGSGKSTLLRLIAGSARADAGDVLLDGIPVESWDKAALAEQGIAYVPQYGELFRGTIVENLTMFRPALRKEALRIARELGLDEVVFRLPQGYHTRVGDGSSDALPRGIIQRIAVVRALATRPKVLLFDEANATMDGAGDEKLRQYLANVDRGCTMILVTLRPSMQKMVDRVLTIKDGRLVDPKALEAAARPALARQSPLATLNLTPVAAATPVGDPA